MFIFKFFGTFQLLLFVCGSSSQRTAGGDQLPPSTVWFPGIKLRWSCLMAAHSVSEPSHQSPTPPPLNILFQTLPRVNSFSEGCVSILAMFVPASAGTRVNMNFS